MKPENNLPPKEIKRHASLERKLAFQELGRRLKLIVGIDLLIVFLFFASLVLQSEAELRTMDFTQPNDANMINFHEAENDRAAFGIRLNHHISRVIDEEPGIVRRFLIAPRLDNRRFYEQMRTFAYEVSLPLENGSFYILTFSYVKAIVIFEYAFAFLLGCECLILFTGYYKIRQAIRRALRPIYDLTLAAQNVNMKNNPAFSLSQTEDLHLSGAIDTLNTITENDLGLRIVISAEREELRGLAQAINSMLDRLDAAYRSQLRFVSDASHELRTPISVIQGYANLLDRWGKNDAVTLQESIDAIKTEAAGMQDLVEQLLFLARSDNRSIVLNIETVNISALAEEIYRETNMIDQNHEFTSRICDGLFVRGDFQLLKQAVRIFVDNAIKYTQKGGKIAISTSTENEYAQISVSDNGIGIPAKDLDKVFDRFFRSDESRTRETGGTGLGLSIAKWIVDRHGGYVEIVSREDVGTKITLFLPKCENAENAAPAQNPQPEE